MASSSSRNACFQCKDSSSSQFGNGWRLRSGHFAQLCNRCAFDVFSCLSSNLILSVRHYNLVHCGCVVSFNAYMLLDFGGVICMECSKKNFVQARKRCLYSENRIGNGVPQGNASRDIQIDQQYWPRVTDLELQQITKKTNSVVIPLFEKLLSSSDIDSKIGCLEIPKKCAEAFFPAITAQDGCPIKIWDTGGKEWELQFCNWPDSSSRKYVLEGLKDYMEIMQWQQGDIVTFYRTEPEKKFIMGLRKTNASALPSEVLG
ncbi:hypothetical protein NMG60_11037136 [Bertholletia excelsa]